MKAAADLIGALIAHICTGVFYVILAYGIGTSFRPPESPGFYWLLYWPASVSPLLLWGVCGVMLVVWWWQGRRPVWPYPFIWALALSGTFLTLVALCFPRVRRMLRPRPLQREPSQRTVAMKRIALAGVGVFALVILLDVGGIQLLPPPETDITQEKPYADFVDREYQVVSDVSAYAWNDFPDKAKILSITLMPPPGVRNRFVSSVTPLKRGQRVRIVSAKKHFALEGFIREYVVLVPGAGLPEGIPITMRVEGDGVPDRRVYKPVGE